MELEIDGEFFNNQCDVMRAEKILAIAEVITNGVIEASKVKDKYFKRMIIEMARVQAGAIMVQPLFPHGKYGGIIVSVND